MAAEYEMVPAWSIEAGDVVLTNSGTEAVITGTRHVPKSTLIELHTATGSIQVPNNIELRRVE